VVITMFVATVGREQSISTSMSSAVFILAIGAKGSLKRLKDMMTVLFSSKVSHSTNVHYRPDVPYGPDCAVSRMVVPALVRRWNSVYVGRSVNL
jgi:hypothetical protein